MITELAPEASELESIVGRSLSRLGGFGLVERAEQGDIASVAAEVAAALGEVGLWELAAHSEQLDAEAAAAACRAAGRVALPYPLAERLSATPDSGADAVAVVNAHAPRLAVHLPDLRWLVTDGGGLTARVRSAGPALGTKLGALVSDVDLDEWENGDSGAELTPLALTLPCWTLLGMCEAAFDQTRQHLLDRHQFGQPLARFQALQFRMADTAAALQGFAELAKYTIWAVGTQQAGRLGDALALRASALETAEQLFRTCHQLHGAMGFCDEVPLSWLSRYSQPLRRLPWARSETEARLLEAIETVPFAGLFSGADDAHSVLVR